MDEPVTARRTAFGAMPDATPVQCLRLGSEPGVVLRVLTLGATVQGLEVQGGDGVRRDVVLGLASVEDYLATTHYLGAVVGRCANRIADGRFELDGVSHQLGVNDRGHTLHGGPDGFDRRVWQVAEQSEDRAVLEFESPDGDQGFPGALSVRATYTVEGPQVRLVLEATAHSATLVNLTSHLYLDLEAAGTIADQELQVAADAFTPVSDDGIPLGEHAPVLGTPFDLRQPAGLGERTRSAHPQMQSFGGIDHNFVLQGEGMREVARLTSRRTRTRMTLTCDRPGLQVFTAGSFDGRLVSKHGAVYAPGAGVALEPQLYPDSPHHPDWPSARVAAGDTSRCEMAWTFSALDS